MSGPRKRQRRDAATHPNVEDGLTGEEEEPGEKSWRELRDTKLPLKKDGGEMELNVSHAMTEWLRSLLERHPGHYRALQALVEGRRDEVTERQINDLLKWGFLTDDRTPIPGAQIIIKAAHRETPDGPALVDPLVARTPEAADLMQEYKDRHEKRKPKAAEQLLRKLRDQDDGPRR